MESDVNKVILYKFVKLSILQLQEMVKEVAAISPKLTQLGKWQNMDLLTFCYNFSGS